MGDPQHVRRLEHPPDRRVIELGEQLPPLRLEALVVRRVVEGVGLDPGHREAVAADLVPVEGQPDLCLAGLAAGRQEGAVF